MPRGDPLVEGDYLDDAPKVDLSSDRLGHARFASRLAATLASLQAPDGYVIGLHGPWGSGKSSVLNFTKGELGLLCEDGIDVPSVIDFKPWMVSGHQDLTAAFMKVLSEQLPERLESRTMRFLRATAAGSDDVLDAVARIGVITDHTGGIAAKGVTGLARRAVGAAKRRWLEEPSLQGTYERLVAALRKQGRRYVVLVDDIDRLAADEIRDLMRMVKTIARLPNVTYVLAYDRAVVWDALAPIDPDRRSGAFAEKIVQQELELPTPTTGALLAMLGEAMAFATFPSEAEERHAALVDAGLSRWIRQPRDVVRLANAVRFLWATLHDEIDPDDLVCLEGLRLYDRRLFDWIRDGRDLLVGQNVLYGEDLRNLAAEEVRRLFATSRARAGTLMALLFPNRSDLFLDKGRITAETWGRVLARRGVATPAGYEAYFGFHPGASPVSRSIADYVASAEAERAALEEILLAAVSKTDERGDTVVGTLIEEVRGRVEAGAHPSDDLLIALVRQGTAIIQAPWAGDAFTPRTQLHLLMFDLLGSWNEERRFGALKSAYAPPAPLSSVAALHVDIARAEGFLPSSGVSRQDVLDRRSFSELSELVMRRIDQGLTEGRLEDECEYYNIARAWAMRDGPEPPREWLARLARSSPQRLARVALGVLGYSRSADGRRYGVFSRPDDLYDVRALLEAALAFQDDRSVDVDGQRRIAALVRELPPFVSASESSDSGKN